MKNLIKYFKAILNIECLNKPEKDHLIQQFNYFMERRDLISRKTIDLGEEDEILEEWSQNNFG